MWAPPARQTSAERERLLSGGGGSCTAAAGHCALTLITRTYDPFERSISACEHISSSMWATSMSVDGRHLLRSDSKRLRGWHAAEQRDELAPSYVEHGLLPGTRCASLPQAQEALKPCSARLRRAIEKDYADAAIAFSYRHLCGRRALSQTAARASRPRMRF